MSDVPRPQDSVEQRLSDLERLDTKLGAIGDRRPAWVDELIKAVRGLRDDIAVAIGELRVETTAHIERVLTEQGSRLIRVQDAIRGELVSGSGQLRTDLERMAEDTSGLRADVRRSFERVLLTINSAEESLTGEVRAIDHRLSGMAEDVRLVRGLRDSLEALASGVDSVRQLAARSATSTQMAELTRDLSTVLAEIESARSQVLAVDQQVGLVQAGAIDVGPAATADVKHTVEKLERTVTDEIGDLGRRIEELAESVIAQPPAPSEPTELTDHISRRLRSLATSARQLGLGVAEDVRARRASRPLKASKQRSLG